MKAKDYLEEKLKNCSRYKLTALDEKFLSKNSIADFIYKKLTSKKFRKWSIDDDSKERVKEAIRVNIDKNEPIKFTYPFGGYKLWRLPSSPEVDWAEFLMIAYYCQYISPILQIHKPGVEFIFSSDDLIIERMNNISKRDTDDYFNSFEKLLKEFSKYFPKNMKMKIKRVFDLYENKEELESELIGHFKKLKNDYPNMDENRKETMIKTSELNFNFGGKEDFTKLSEIEKIEKIKLGLIFHDAQCSLVKRRDFVRGKDKVVLFTTKIPNAIAIGTTKTSITKFWTGIGVLEVHKNKIKDRILSPKQLDSVENEKTETEKVDLIALRNFDEIKKIIK